MNSADMASLVPDPDDLLRMPTEKQGVFILKLMSMNDDSEHPVSREDFFARRNDSRRAPKYGAGREAWTWLENHGYLEHSRMVRPNRFFVGPAGRNFIVASAEAEQLERLSGLITARIDGATKLPLVAHSRLAELRGLTSTKFDFKKLIRLCEELNAASQVECHLATAMLTRALLDHVPSIFGQLTFKEVANNYGGGGKSFKETMHRGWVRLHEKGGKEHEAPCIPKLETYLNEYIAAAGIGDDKDEVLFRTTGRSTGFPHRMTQQDAYRLIQRDANRAGIKTRVGNHSMRATGTTDYLKSGGSLSEARKMGNHADTRTTQLYDRRGDSASLDEYGRIGI